jgi:hypothetical protein
MVLPSGCRTAPDERRTDGGSETRARRTVPHDGRRTTAGPGSREGRRAERHGRARAPHCAHPSSWFPTRAHDPVDHSQPPLTAPDIPHKLHYVN